MSAMSQGRPTLLSLCDALIYRILYYLVDGGDARTAVRTICLISRRFAQLLKQPLTAWGKLVSVYDLSGVPQAGLAHLTQWLATVGPAVRELKLFTGWPDVPAPELQHKISAAAFLPAMKGLQVLDYTGTQFLADDIAAAAGLTALTSLSCDCWLDGVVAPLHSLSSLIQLRRLDLTVQGLRQGEQLPDRLAALSRLETLALSVRYSSEADTQPYVCLPRAWCQAAAQVRCLYLDNVDLPQLAGHASSSDICVFPALSELHVWNPVGPLSTSALVCCQSVKVLRVDLADLGAADLGGFASLTNLESLDLRRCDLPPASEPEPPSQAMSGLTALTSLTLYSSDFHPTMAQLPALRHLVVEQADWQQGVGWQLPAGPWLQKLERLSLTGCVVGSVEAVLRQGTRLTSLTMDNCPWLRLSRDELPLLLALPLRVIKLNKNPWGNMVNFGIPSPLWDEDSLWVVEEFQNVMRGRWRPGKPGQWVSCSICTEEWEREGLGSEGGDEPDA